MSEEKSFLGITREELQVGLVLMAVIMLLVTIATAYKSGFFELEWHRHPIFVLIMGAIFSSILVPALARGWQSRQKELEVKIALVSEISQITMRFLSTAEIFAESGEANAHLERLEEQRRAWLTERAVMATKLDSYYDEEETVSEIWDNVCKESDRLYSELQKSGRGRSLDVEKVQDQLGDLFAKKREIIREILEVRINALHSSFPFEI